jgi:hypothetical protein
VEPAFLAGGVGPLGDRSGVSPFDELPDDEVGAAIATLDAELRRYPPLQEYARALDRSFDRYEERGIETARDLMWDLALYAALLLSGRHPQDWLREPRMRLSAAWAVLSAVPVLWPDELLQAALALELPPHVVAEDVLPYPGMYWCFQRPRGNDAEFAAFLVEAVDGAAEVIGLSGVRGNGGIELTLRLRVPFGRRWPDDFEDPGSAATILKLLAFMNSRFTVDEAERLSRADRKLIDPEHAVHVVRLRSPEPSGGPSSASAGEARGSRYSHRFIVRGHYRAQWYSSIQAHRVRWIAPFLKGPPDAPLLQPAVRVQR